MTVQFILFCIVMSLCTFIYNIIIKTIINTYFPPLLMIVVFIFNLLLLIPALAPPPPAGVLLGLVLQAFM